MKRFQIVAGLFAMMSLFALAACGPGDNAARNAANTPATGNGDTDNGDTGNGDTDNGDTDNGDIDNGDAGDGKDDADIDAMRKQMVANAWDFLVNEYNRAPADDDHAALKSGWGEKSTNVPYTALVLHGLIGTEVWNPGEAMFEEAVNWLLDVQEPTGAWSYRPGVPGFKGVRAVYITAIMAQLLVDLNNTDGPWKGKLNNQIAAASEYLQQSQVGNPGGPAPDYGRDQVGFGGWAYSREEIERNVEERGKPAANMSTTSFALDALHAIGVSKDDPLWEDALVFLKRNQNAGEVQDEGFSAMHEGKVIRPAGEGSPDHGGAIYSEETSKATGVVENEDGTVTLFSYGSMTYNLLRGYLFAGLNTDDVPVQLAWRWIQRNYTVERVPGFREPAEYDMGLYYYYLSMAKTLDAMGVDHVEEADRGLKHDWRKDLLNALNERQRDDGSWVNENHTRWQEDSKVLCTAYILNAIRHTKE